MHVASVEGVGILAGQIPFVEDYGPLVVFVRHSPDAMHGVVIARKLRLTPLEYQ